jgi:hypothetical protein
MILIVAVDKHKFKGGFMESDDMLLPDREAGKVIGFSRSWLQKDRLKKVPLVPFIKIGTNARYKKSDLQKFIKNQNRNHREVVNG